MQALSKWIVAQRRQWAMQWTVFQRSHHVVGHSLNAVIMQLESRSVQTSEQSTNAGIGL